MDMYGIASDVSANAPTVVGAKRDVTRAHDTARIVESSMDDDTETECALVAASVAFLVGDDESCPDYGCDRIVR